MSEQTGPQPCPFTITDCDVPEETGTLRYDFTRRCFVLERDEEQPAPERL
jgi:hypothetical protein